MSRFDNLQYKHEIPERLTLPISLLTQTNLNDLSYQTKGFDGGYFENYLIDEDGLLLKSKDKYDDAYNPTDYHFCSNYTGVFNFYSNFYPNAYALKTSYIEFKCQIVDGKVTELKLVEYGP